jgi:hypothetical protein
VAGSNGECLMDGSGMELHSSNATNYILELAMNSISKSRGVVDEGAGDNGDSDPGDEPMIKRWQNGNSHHSSHRGLAAGLKRPFGHGGYSNGSGGVPHHHSQAHDEDDSSEDELFCRIMMKKLRRMNDETKERAKAKIMDLLCKIQYGE